ncbi:hypothetical protein [Acaryochloris sp. CCMEE 5410]|uniref:hypothetical protein n=1 Tax=Acaryochloris sp. CCMEE 5410 TaxID=310037 RepID=UPI0002484B53|nr:hypothetical protein [Acaryochloris sp. CCMEE 5410]KAI9131317.1 hypothetical protein ON05_027145 [Acaryochloris sp. CCMEE 5410]
MTEDSDKITIEQAYLAAYEYLLRRWKYIPERLIADELSDMSLLDDGCSADPACKHEFVEALHAVLDAEDTPEGYRRADQQLN